MEWPRDFGQSGWSHSWHWSAIRENIEPEELRGTDGDANTALTYRTAINITFPDGHTTQYKIARVKIGHWQVPGSYPWFGPPYSDEEIQSEWPYGGTGVHDHLCNMAANGSEFWLCRADGGSVHFIWDANYGYQAREVFDPHGLKTELRYTIGYLTRVEQEGGRYLDLTWENFSGGGYMITRVDSGTAYSGTGTNQTVHYHYAQFPGTSALSLHLVVYANERLPGGGPNDKVTATYTYGTCWGDGPEPCTGAYDRAPLPLLKRAHDPHFAGPMTAIRYDYNGVGCLPPTLNPEFHPDFVAVQPYAIVAEKSDTGLSVSTFFQPCDSGYRREDTGLGAWRDFYFGTSAQTTESSPGGTFLCRGFQLGKLTNFATGGQSTVPYERQNFAGGDPHHIWDARDIRTEAIAQSGDDSGEPAEIRRVDTSVDYYNRVNPGASAPIDPAQGMHNPYNHWVFSETHPIDGATSHTTTYTRDARRRVTRIDYPGGGYETFVYNQFNQVTSHRLPSGAVQTFEYDGRGLLQREFNSVDGWEGRKEYLYYVAGEAGGTADLVKAVSDGRSREAQKDFSTRMTYNGRCQVLTVEYAGMNTAADNPTVRYGYDLYGNCASITDELGHESVYDYDDYRRCTSYTEPLNAPGWNGTSMVASRRWDWIYDRYVPGIGQKSAPAHTGKSWRIQIEPVFNAESERRLTARWHDVENRVVLESSGWIATPTTWVYGPDARTESWTFDANGNKESHTDPHGRVTDYTYDLRNRLKETIEPKRADQSSRPTTTMVYDFAGNKTDVTFPDTKSQHWHDYDAFGQPGRFVDERDNTTELAYKPWGPMKKLAQVRTYRDKDGGGTEPQPTTFEYDGLGRPQWTIFPDGSSELTTYVLGQIDAFKTRKNQTKRLHYDARGREQYHTWEGPAAAPRIDRLWDDANRMTAIWNSVATINYAYDDAGQPKYEISDVAGAGGPAQTTYNRYPNGEVAHVDYPDAFPLHKDYTARGQVKSVRVDVPGYASYVDYTYHADGTVDHEEYPLNGMSVVFGYDDRGLVASVQHKRSATGQVIFSRTYTRDSRDRITSWVRGTDATLNPMENGRGNRYLYDFEGQLTDAYYGAADPAGTPTNWAREDHFNYDALGNRRGWDHVASRAQWMNFTRKDNGLNQYRAWWPYSFTNYDDDIGNGWGSPGAANGVLMQDGWITGGYNALNQPMYIWSATSGWSYFGYDPLGRCVKRWKDGEPAVFLYYDGWNLIQEGPSATVPELIYVHGAGTDRIVASYRYSTGAAFYFYYDALGNCILASDAYTGNIAEQYDYDAFGHPDSAGTPLPNGSTIGTRFLFTGREWLSDLKLYDYRNRLYQPELGRFLQPDPKHFTAGDYNLYRYCHNDPVNRSDPTGLASRSDELIRLKAITHKVPLGSHIKQWVVTGMVTIAKSAFTQLVNSAFQTNIDKTQNVYKDGYISNVANAREVRTNSRGAFDLTKKEEVFKFQSGHGGIALMMHVHNYDDGHGGTMFPNDRDDWKAVRDFQAPMLFTSEPLYERGMGVFVAPNGQKTPTETVVDLNR
jgi:RHS repeat-associated protein